MNKISQWLIKFYQKIISPLHKQCCKYYPSCSHYAMESFKKHGFIKGLILSIWRLLRCNPWSNGGIDYVPEKFNLLHLKNGK